MSALDRPVIEQAIEVIEKAEKELDNVCNGERRFTMCVPAQDDDTDIVIGDAFYIARQLQTKLADEQNERRKLDEIMEAQASTIGLLYDQNAALTTLRDQLALENARLKEAMVDMIPKSRPYHSA